MFRALLRPGQVLMLLALLVASGGYWMALQSVAWARMLVVYSHDAQFSVAAAKTFDGRHPCAWCKTIEQARKSERPAPAAVVIDGKPSFLFAEVCEVGPRVAGLDWEQEIKDHRARSRREPPPLPPPRPGLG